MRIRLLSLFSSAFIWLGIMGIPNGYLTLGYLIAATLLTMFCAIKFSLLPQEVSFNTKIFSYFLWLLKEIYLSSMMVIKIAWRKRMMLTPELSAVKSIQPNDAGLVLYANSITLTPGTITLNIMDNALLVHALDTSAMEGLKEGSMDRNVEKVINVCL